MPVGVSCFVLLYMYMYLHCDVVTLYSWHYFYLSLPLPCCVPTFSVLLVYCTVSGAWVRYSRCSCEDLLEWDGKFYYWFSQLWRTWFVVVVS